MNPNKTTLSVDKKLKTLIAELFRVQEEEISDSLAMADLDVWDSLKHMELIVAIEETFDVELTFDEIVAMQNLKEIKRVLEQKKVTG